MGVVSKTRNFKDKQKALSYAERCLQSDAGNERALYLISQLRRNVHSKKRQQGYIKILMLAIGGLILVLGGYLIWSEYNKNPVITPSINSRDNTRIYPSITHSCEYSVRPKS